GENLLNGRGGDDNILAGQGKAILIGEAGNDLLFGSQKDDSLDGGDGNDILQGNGGAADTLKGGAGNDRYLEIQAGNTLIEDFNGGIDEVFIYNSYSLGANFENLTLLASGGYVGTR